MRGFLCVGTILLSLLCSSARAEDDAEERRAAGQLKLGEMLHAGGKFDKAKQRYEEIIRTWPETEAAREARKLLAGKAPDMEARCNSGVMAISVPIAPLPAPVYASRRTAREDNPEVEPGGSLADGGSAASYRNAPGGYVSGAGYSSPSTLGVGFYPVGIRAGGGYYSSGAGYYNGYKPVYVRSYVRRDGTPVRSYYRSLPGTGLGRRR